MKANISNSIALQPMGRNGTPNSSLSNAVAGSTSAQPAVQDIERDTLDGANGPNNGLRNALPSKRAMKFAAIGTAAAALIGGASYGINKAVTTAVKEKQAEQSAARLAKNKADYCNQFSAFNWVAPNFVGANVTTLGWGGENYLEGNYINFHNEPQNLTGACMNLFGSGNLVSNPNQTTVDALNHYGPFPGSSSWNYVDMQHGDVAPLPYIKVLYFTGVSDFNPKA